jgi:hypothetical protein
MANQTAADEAVGIETTADGLEMALQPHARGQRESSNVCAISLDAYGRNSAPEFRGELLERNDSDEPFGAFVKATKARWRIP